METCEGEKCGALGIEEGAQAGGEGNDLCGCHHEKEEWQREREGGAELALAASGQPRGRGSKERGDDQGDEYRGLVDCAEG